MTIKFHIEEVSEKQLHFSDVEEDQFFLDSAGTLCVKSSSDAYVSLTDALGHPMVTIENYVSGGLLIEKILPHVTKITWE